MVGTNFMVDGKESVLRIVYGQKKEVTMRLVPCLNRTYRCEFKGGNAKLELECGKI